MRDLLFTGDTFLRCNDKHNNGENPFTSSVEELFKETQNICINLETTVGEGGEKSAKAYNFQTNPNSLFFLQRSHVRICSLANNHSLDYGKEGLSQTIHHLKQFGFSYIGTERNNLEQVKVADRIVSICSYYGNSNGLARLNQKEILEDIKRYKQSSDYVFVCLHWGEEYVPFPSPSQQKIAHALIDGGVDVIIGHHPHVMQGMERYKQGLVFYSLGNFNFFVDHPYAKELVETTKAYVVGFNIHPDVGIDYEIIPININDSWQPEVITDRVEINRFNKYFNDISEGLKGNISQVLYLAEAAPHHFHNHFPSWKKRIKQYGGGQLILMLKWLIHPATYRYYLGLLFSIFHKSVRLK